MKAQRPSAWCCATFLLCWHHHGTIELGLEKGLFPFSLGGPAFLCLPSMPGNQHRKAFCSLPCLPAIIMKPIEPGQVCKGEAILYIHPCLVQASNSGNWQKQKNFAEYRREGERGHVSGSTTRLNWRAGNHHQLTLSRRQEAG